MAQFNQKVVALHTINRTIKPGVAATKDTKAIKPEVQEIAPGTIFVPKDETEFGELMAAKAISLDIPKSATVLPMAPANDGPGVVVVKEDDSPFADAADRTSWVERGAKVNVNVGDNWKPATIRKKVTEAEAAAAAQAAKDSNQSGGDGTELV